MLVRIDISVNVDRYRIQNKMGRLIESMTQYLTSTAVVISALMVNLHASMANSVDPDQTAPI